ncbi:hypothetical protein JCM33774_85850 [Actinophytocola sp. KF-1]
MAKGPFATSGVMKDPFITWGIHPATRAAKPPRADRHQARPSEGRRKPSGAEGAKAHASEGGEAVRRRRRQDPPGGEGAKAHPNEGRRSRPAPKALKPTRVEGAKPPGAEGAKTRPAPKAQHLSRGEAEPAGYPGIGSVVAAGREAGRRQPARKGLS